MQWDNWDRLKLLVCVVEKRPAIDAGLRYDHHHILITEPIGPAPADPSPGSLHRCMLESRRMSRDVLHAQAMHQFGQKAHPLLEFLL